PARERKMLSRLPEVAWEREKTVAELGRRLLDSKDNLVLVGDQGVGKTTLWNDVVKWVARESKTEEQPVTVWRTTSQRLISKAKYLGEWQEICDEVIEALALVNGILWITDLAELLRCGGESPEDSVAAYLQAYIAKGQLRLIGEMRPQQVEATRALLPSFIHYFEPVLLDELDPVAAAKVLRHYARYAAINFNIDVNNDALDLSFQLVNRYIKYEKSPGKQVRFFGECIKQLAHQKASSISRDDIIRIFTQYTGLPEILLRDDIALSDAELMAFFSRKIIGQEPILETLCNVVQTFKAGLNDPNKPIATLLFAGPTGVGKTAATKALASYFFDAGQSKHPLFRIDMSEFQHPGHIVRLIGDHESPGKLVQHVRTNPFSVVLLDEIEKADASVFDALLTVFDEGMLTDRFGRTTDFRSSIIIMTSNLGANESSSMGFHAGENTGVSITAIRKFFRPEFFNRIDAVLSFRSLSQEHVRAITKIEMMRLLDRDRIKELNLTLTFSDGLVDHIAGIGFSPIYGARPIQRAIEKHVVRALSEYLQRASNQSVAVIDFRDGQVVVG
ncbi:MAG: AAA family ATPase, partial [Pseudomonadales bacterium]|nr:AAA family ATPase [Pseudomonadales bacterium]